MSGRIVVGVDGSDGSLRALRWAVREARQRDATLDVVVAWHHPYAAAVDPTGMAASRVSREELEHLSRDLLGRARDVAYAEDQTVQVDPTVVEGGAARALLEAATGADLLVVGSRGRGGFTGLLLGSVSQQCAHHAPCPVVIVPGADRAEH
jgi:nucleotide-binding universal stress UspA family protein